MALVMKEYSAQPNLAQSQEQKSDVTRLFDKGPRKGDTCVKKEFKTGAVYENELFEQDVLVGNKAYIVGTASGFQYPPRSIGCHLRGRENMILKEIGNLLGGFLEVMLALKIDKNMILTRNTEKKISGSRLGQLYATLCGVASQI